MTATTDTSTAAADTSEVGRTHYAVAVYAIARAYGGPEEGGWWYDEGELVGVDAFLPDEDAAYDRAGALNATYKPEGTWRDEGLSARVVAIPRRVLPPALAAEACHDYGDHDDAEMVTRWDVPAFFPEHRPHYC